MLERASLWCEHSERCLLATSLEISTACRQHGRRQTSSHLFSVYEYERGGKTGEKEEWQAAKKLAQNLTHYYAPIDVLKQDIFRHKVNMYTTNKNYIIHNHKNLGGTTIHQKKPILNKILREILRPLDNYLRW